MLNNAPESLNLPLAHQDTRVNTFFIDFLISQALGWSFWITLAYFNFGFLGFLSFFIVRFLYFFLSENSNGKTLGKKITKTKAVNISGNKPSAIQIVKRSLFRNFTLILTFISDDFQAFHDKYSGTYVIIDTI